MYAQFSYRLAEPMLAPSSICLRSFRICFCVHLFSLMMLPSRTQNGRKSGPEVVSLTRAGRQAGPQNGVLDMLRVGTVLLVLWIGPSHFAPRNLEAVPRKNGVGAIAPDTFC
jgi:hypothetical protein